MDCQLELAEQNQVLEQANIEEENTLKKHTSIVRLDHCHSEVAYLMYKGKEYTSFRPFGNSCCW